MLLLSLCPALNEIRTPQLHDVFFYYELISLFLVFFPLLPGHTDTLIFDILKLEWSVAVTSPPSSVTTNKVSGEDFEFACCCMLATFAF